MTIVHPAARGDVAAQPADLALRSGETIVFASAGRIVPRAGFARSGWTITVTTERLLCTRPARGGTRVIELDRRSIRSAHVQSSPFTMRAVVITDVGKLLLDQLGAGGARSVVAALLSGSAAPLSGSPAPLGSSPSQRNSLPLASHEAILDRIESLESEVEELRAQVRFLEALSSQPSR